MNAPAAVAALLWCGPAPKHCDVDYEPIGDVFIDGVVRTGSWGIMCPSCHRKFGLGLGHGRGQKYRRREDGRFEKVEG